MGGVHETLQCAMLLAALGCTFSSAASLHGIPIPNTRSSLDSSPVSRQRARDQYPDCVEETTEEDALRSLTDEVRALVNRFPEEPEPLLDNSGETNSRIREVIALAEEITGHTNERGAYRTQNGGLADNDFAESSTNRIQDLAEMAERMSGRIADALSSNHPLQDSNIHDNVLECVRSSSTLKSCGSDVSQCSSGAYYQPISHLGLTFSQIDQIQVDELEELCRQHPNADTDPGEKASLEEKICQALVKYKRWKGYQEFRYCNGKTMWLPPSTKLKLHEKPASGPPVHFHDMFRNLREGNDWVCKPPVMNEDGSYRIPSDFGQRRSKASGGRNSKMTAEWWKSMSVSDAYEVQNQKCAICEVG